MSNWTEREHEWEKAGRAEAAEAIAKAFAPNDHREALITLLGYVANNASAMEATVRSYEPSAKKLRDAMDERDIKALVTSAARLYWLLEPLRRALDRELVLLGEMARDVDEPGKEGGH